MGKVIGVLPLSQTSLLPINLSEFLVQMIVMIPLLGGMAPKTEKCVEASDEFVDSIKPQPVVTPELGTPAMKFNYSKILGIGLGIIALFWAARHIWLNGLAGINFNVSNFVFLFIGLVLHRTPEHFMQSAARGVNIVVAILVQFPLYAGMFGIITNTGLGAALTEFFVSISTGRIFPSIAYVYSAILNMFVPSGGSKLVIEAPYIVPAAQELGVQASTIINAYTMGDNTTNIIQPFRALPVLMTHRDKRIFSSNSKALLTWILAVLLSIMNSKRRETLEAIFSEPVPKNLLWDDIESLLKAVGCKVKNRGGSKVGFGKDNEMLYAHRPYPQKEAKIFAVNKVRAFFERLGVTP